MKQLAEARLAKSLQGRLEYHAARYGAGNSWAMRRTWITSDGVEVTNFSNAEWFREYAAVAEHLRQTNACTDFRDPAQAPGYYQAYNEAQAMLERRCIFSRDALVDALSMLLDFSIDDALRASSSLIQALAMMDRRLGKRRLLVLNTDQIGHPLVHSLYTIRCEAEGMALPVTTTSRTEQTR